MVRLFVDHRERWWTEAEQEDDVEQSDIQVEWMTLDLGDFMIESDGEQVMLIERKTVKDLWASLRDGRFREQLHRIRQNPPVLKPLYIIEGSINFFEEKLYGFDDVEMTSMRSACRNLMIRDRIPVIFTSNTRMTRNAILDMCAAIASSPHRYGSSVTANTTPYVAPKKASVKNDSRSMVISMLTCFPRVSQNIAATIVDYYFLNPEEISFQKLIEIIKTRNDLDQIKVNNRKLSSNIVDLIRKVIIGT
jgi:ERCC4-type nuclease